MTWSLFNLFYEEQYSQEEDSDDCADTFESDEEYKETMEYDTDFSDSDSE